MTHPSPDLLVDGATILTSDPARPFLKTGWVEVTAGRITAIRDTRPERIAPSTRIVPGGGRVLTPGFVNVHTHAILSMVRGVAEDM
ncbi:hypothetical protein JMM59_19140, partial [Rhodovulum sulfidophilum]|uniref:amidohydrolase family protein n=1 Tax=Rhodovulum sulfidophilum TaxID=35806 RepID=UPI001A48DC1E|nr:hypothetical protein [Rhodovulum sulfidophilum]